MDFVVAVFGFGSLLLLIGVLGGGLTVGGVKVPEVARRPRIAAGILGTGLMLASGGLWTFETFSGRQPGSSPTAMSSAQPGHLERSPGWQPTSEKPSDKVLVTVHRELLLRHREERLDIAVEQRPLASVLVDRVAPSGSLELVLSGDGLHRYEAVLIARDDAGDEFVFHGRGALDTRQDRVFRARLDLGSAAVVLEPD